MPMGEVTEPICPKLSIWPTQLDNPLSTAALFLNDKETAKG